MRCAPSIPSTHRRANSPRVSRTLTIRTSRSFNSSTWPPHEFTPLFTVELRALEPCPVTALRPLTSRVAARERCRPHWPPHGGSIVASAFAVVRVLTIRLRHDPLVLAVMFPVIPSTRRDAFERATLAGGGVRQRVPGRGVAQHENSAEPSPPSRDPVATGNQRARRGRDDLGT